MYKDFLVFKNTIYLYARSLLILFVSLFTSRVILNALGSTDYGLYILISGFITLIVFFNTAVVNSIQRYLNCALGKNNIDEYEKIVGSSILVQAAIVLILLTVGETFGYWFVLHKINIPPNRHSISVFVYNCTLIAFLVKSFQTTLTSIILSKERMKFYAFQGVVESVGILLISLSILYTDIDKLQKYSILILVNSVLILLMNLYYVNNIMKVNIVPLKYSKTIVFELLNFSGWNLLGAMSSILRSQGLNIVFNIFFGLTVNAARGLSSQVYAGVSSFVANFQMALQPQIIQTYSERSYIRHINLVNYGAKFSFYIMWIISLPVFLSVDKLIIFWLGNSIPEHTDCFIILALLTGLVETFAAPFSISISANGNIKLFQIIISISKVSIIPISIFCCMHGWEPEEIISLGIGIEMVTMIFRLIIWKFITGFDIRSLIFDLFVRTSLVLSFSYMLSSSIYDMLNTGYYSIICAFIISIPITITVIYTIGFSKKDRIEFINFIRRYFEVANAKIRN